MLSEPLIGGGKLVVLNDGRIAVEGVPQARRGLVVCSASSHLDGDRHYRAAYRLTQRVAAGLWRVQRAGKVPA